MRKTLVLAGCALLVAPLTFAQNEVLSANAVGYVKKTIEPGNLALLRYDFLAIDGSPTLIGDVIAADQVGDGSRAFLWDTVNQQFSIENVVAGKSTTAWNPGTSEIVPGISFFLQIADSAPVPVDVVMVGEVPGSNNNSDSTSVDVVEGLTLAGFPYPVTVNWVDTTLAQSASDGDRLFTWDAVNQAYLIDNYVVGKSSSAWNPGDKVLQPGDGFFYEKNTAGTTAWVENKPYTWP
jgi:hypothetical protein